MSAMSLLMDRLTSGKPIPYLAEGRPSHTRTCSEHEALSTREKECAVLFAMGAKNRQCAEKLFISIKTVQKHRAAIYVKMGVHSAPELTIRCLHARMFTLEQAVSFLNSKKKGS